MFWVIWLGLVCCLGLLVSWVGVIRIFGFGDCWFDCCFFWVVWVVRACCILVLGGLLMVWGLVFHFDFGCGGDCCLV